MSQVPGAIAFCPRMALAVAAAQALCRLLATQGLASLRTAPEGTPIATLRLLKGPVSCPRVSPAGPGESQSRVLTELFICQICTTTTMCHVLTQRLLRSRRSRRGSDDNYDGPPPQAPPAQAQIRSGREIASALDHFSRRAGAQAPKCGLCALLCA